MSMTTTGMNGTPGQGAMRSPLARGMAAVLSAALAGAPASAQTLASVSDLAGQRTAAGQAELRARGFALVYTHTSGATSWQYWWNGQRSQCVMAMMSGGQFERISATDEHDCNQQSAAGAQAASQSEATPGMSNGAKVAIGAAALLGVAALLHKSHERKKERTESNAQDTAEYERGYRDGTYNQTYHNYNNHREYSDGYSAGSQKRADETRYRSYQGHHSGYSPYINVNDLVGARAAGAEGDLRSRGFRSTSGYKANDRAYTYWWNGGTRQCLSAAVYDGRLDAIASVGETYCQR